MFIPKDIRDENKFIPKDITQLDYIMVSCHGLLMTEVDLSEDFFAILLSKGVLTLKEANILKGYGYFHPFMRRQFLNLIVHKGFSTYFRFLDALVDNGQRNIVEALMYKDMRFLHQCKQSVY